MKLPIVTLKDLSILILNCKSGNSVDVNVIHLETKTVLRILINIERHHMYIYIGNYRLDRLSIKINNLESYLRNIFLTYGLRLTHRDNHDYPSTILAKSNIIPVKSTMFKFFKELKVMGIIDRQIYTASFKPITSFDGFIFSLGNQYYDTIILFKDSVKINFTIVDNIFESNFRITISGEDYSDSYSLQSINYGDTFNLKLLLKEFIKTMLKYNLRGPGKVIKEFH